MVGVGKSYLVSLKVSATLSSLGTPSVAFSANDLQHGGLGAIQKNNDVLLIFSVSGESLELNSILRYANRHNIPITINRIPCKTGRKRPITPRIIKAPPARTHLMRDIFANSNA